MKIRDYIDDLLENGERSFTIQEVCKKLKKSRQYIRNEIAKLKAKKILISPISGFYVIIPFNYRTLGSLPGRDLIIHMMKHLGYPYYAGLLTAAAMYGATHQRLRVFQVVTSKRMPKKRVFGQVWLEFIYKKDIKDVEIKKKAVDAGYLPVSTPEETAKDVMTYYRQCGGLNHQATVLAELAGALNTKKLISLAKRSSSLFWVQRMGYILENIDTFYEKERDKVVASLERFIKEQKPRYIPLAPEMPTKGKPRNKKWKIIENTTVESDI